MKKKKTTHKYFSLTCPVCSVSSLLIRYIKKNLKSRHVLTFPPSFVHRHTCRVRADAGIHSHVIGQVVFIKSVSLKAVRRCIKVVASDPTYEAFCLQRINGDEESSTYVTVTGLFYTAPPCLP